MCKSQSTQVFFSCNNLPTCLISKRQATWGYSTSPTTLLIFSNSMWPCRLENAELKDILSYFCLRSFKWNSIDDFVWSKLFSNWGMPSKVYLELNKYFISEKTLQNTSTHQLHFFCSWCQNWHAIQFHDKEWLNLECSYSLVRSFRLLCSFQSTARTYNQEKKGLDTSGWGNVQDEQMPWRIQHVQVFRVCQVWFANLFFSFYYLFV